MDERPDDSRPDTTRFEDYPLTRAEYISVMVHFYRGEVGRSTSWRERLDATTNWAVLTTAGMLSFSLADKQQEHIILLLSNLIILCYLLIESRRFRYFEVYRARVRMLEENFLIPVVTRELESSMKQWRKMVARDLDLPKYKTTLLESIGFRLRQNYFYIFLIVLGGWLVKLIFHPSVAHSGGELWRRVGGGWVPSWVVVACGLLFYFGLMAVMWYARHVHVGEPDDEISGLEGDLGLWKK